MEETYIMNAHNLPCREYCIRLRLTDPATYPPDAGISFEQVLPPPLWPADVQTRTPCTGCTKVTVLEDLAGDEHGEV